MRPDFFDGEGSVGEAIANEALLIVRDVPDAGERAAVVEVVIATAFEHELDARSILERLRHVRMTPAHERPLFDADRVLQRGDDGPPGGIRTPDLLIRSQSL